MFSTSNLSIPVIIAFAVAILACIILFRFIERLIISVLVILAILAFLFFFGATIALLIPLALFVLILWWIGIKNIWVDVILAIIAAVCIAALFYYLFMRSNKNIVIINLKKGSSKRYPKQSPKVSTKASAKVTPKASAKVTPKASAKATPKKSPKVTPKKSPKVTPKATPKKSTR